MSTYVIVGGGQAGASAAATLRAEGFGGRVVIVASEPELPYERPPLSKTYLAGASTLADAHVDYGPDVELLSGTSATALDLGERRVELSDGGELTYDALLIATGAVPRRPPIPGAEHAVVLRTVADSDALRAKSCGGARLVVVGGGWIGCEVAATARGLGAEVTLIERGGAPLGRVLGPQVGGFFADLHRSHGVDVVLNSAVDAIEPGGVRLTGGRAIACDTVLLAVGVAPATGLAEAAGLAVDDGIVTDEQLRTAAPGVFAAGDVASALHPRYGRRLRVEHWDNAQAQGTAAARSMLGAEEPYARLPYFFSDQYDLGLEYVGLHDPGDEVVIHGNLADAKFQAFWIGADGAVTAGMHVNDWDAIDRVREIVEAATPARELGAALAG